MSSLVLDRETLSGSTKVHLCKNFKIAEKRSNQIDHKYFQGKRRLLARAGALQSRSIAPRIRLESAEKPAVGSGALARRAGNHLPPGARELGHNVHRPCGHGRLLAGGALINLVSDARPVQSDSRSNPGAAVQDSGTPTAFAIRCHE